MKMATEIEGIYKDGKILPLEEIKLEENTKVFISIPAKLKEKPISLAGAWKNYKTADGKNIDWLKREIYRGRKISTRKHVAL